MIRGRVFSIQDQLAYACLSGDFNPIHVDPLYARRSASGLLVHGMHVALWALDGLAEQHDALGSPLSVVFLKPVLLDQPVSVEVRREPTGWRVSASQGNATCVTMLLKTQARLTPDVGLLKELDNDVAVPLSKSFEELRGERGEVLLAANASALDAAFPFLSATWGTRRVAAMNALSRLVGMVCPGLNSLFSGFQVELDSETGDSIRYEVVRVRSSHAPIKIAVGGGGLRGELTAFYRPEPVVQPSFSELRCLIEPGEFEGIKALVVGGSRGIGEVAAKLLAAGGAKVSVTHNHGRNDAERIRDEIHVNGGECQIGRLDVLDLASGDITWLQEEPFDQVYYFATPIIRANTSEVPNVPIQRDYERYYVEGFAGLMRIVGHAKCRAFYPSTVYITEKRRGFTEYVNAKEAGERLAKLMDTEGSVGRICIGRLPRMLTDQTNTLSGPKASEPSRVLLDVIRGLCRC